MADNNPYAFPQLPQQQQQQFYMGGPQMQQQYGGPQMQQQQLYGIQQPAPPQMYGMAQAAQPSYQASELPRRVQFAAEAAKEKKEEAAKPEEEETPEEEKVVAAIMTIYSSSSYDPLFRQTRQKAPDGKVIVWETDYKSLEKLRDFWDGGEGDARNPWKEFFDECGALDNESVLFNFECCGACSEHGFGVKLDKGNIPKVIEEMVVRGHSLMFSDFAVKALINAWSNKAFDAAIMGEGSPVKQIGTLSNSIDLRFDPKVLQACEASSQLQKVGELCEDGKAHLHALGGTVVFGMEPSVTKAKDQLYTTEILTEVVHNDFRDAVGHVLFTFEKTNATILLSAGHWVELAKLSGVSLDAVLRVAEQFGGAAEAAEFRNAYMNSAAPVQAQMLQAQSAMYVQQSAPCKWSKK